MCNSNTSMNNLNEELEAVPQRCSVKKVFLEISQKSQENICARVSFFIKLQALGLQLYKKETLAQVFSYEFCKIFTEFLYKTPLDDCFCVIKSHQLSKYYLSPFLLFRCFFVFTFTFIKYVNMYGG